MSKLVPSPDWFVGLDGLNLCENGKFVDSVTVEVHISWNLEPLLWAMHHATLCACTMHHFQSRTYFFSIRHQIMEHETSGAGNSINPLGWHHR